MTLRPKADHIIEAEKLANMIFEKGPAMQQEMLEVIKIRLNTLNVQHIEKLKAI